MCSLESGGVLNQGLYANHAYFGFDGVASECTQDCWFDKTQNLI